MVFLQGLVQWLIFTLYHFRIARLILVMVWIIWLIMHAAVNKNFHNQAWILVYCSDFGAGVFDVNRVEFLCGEFIILTGHLRCS